MLKEQYGHFEPGDDVLNTSKYHLHVKIDNRPINQGLCFLNNDQNTYYMSCRKNYQPNQLPKEIITMVLEKSVLQLAHTHVEFFLTGIFHNN